MMTILGGTDLYSRKNMSHPGGELRSFLTAILVTEENAN
jgi:hypothetical protein